VAIGPRRSPQRCSLIFGDASTPASLKQCAEGFSSEWPELRLLRQKMDVSGNSARYFFGAPSCDRDENYRQAGCNDSVHLPAPENTECQSVSWLSAAGLMSPSRCPEARNLSR
jgi:hypothetical protein